MRFNGWSVTLDSRIPTINTCGIFTKNSDKVTFTTITSISSGDWSNATIWGGGVVPTSSDNVIIADGNVVLMDNDFYATRYSGTTTTVNFGGTLATKVNYINNGTTTIKGSFQINQGGFGSGSGLWTYDDGTLIFNNSTSVYGPIDSGHSYWPMDIGRRPLNVDVAGPGGIDIGVSKIVDGTFQTVSGIKLSSATLTINGRCQINANGFFYNAPNYGPNSILVYSVGGYYGRGLEWSSTSGAGYPSSIQLSNNTTLDYPNTGSSAFAAPLQIEKNLIIDLGCSLYMGYGDYGNKSSKLSIGGNLINNGNFSLGNMEGSDLEIGGNWNSSGSFYPNDRAVFFTSTIPQTITGPTTFDYLTLNNISGLSLQPASTVIVNKTLDLNAGKIILGNSNLTVSGLFSNFTNINFIVTNGTGQLKRPVNNITSVTFPVGNSSYNPILFESAGIPDVYGVRIVDESISNGFFNLKTVKRKWFVSENETGGSNLKVAVQYNVGDENNDFNGATNPKIGFYNGTSWTEVSAIASGTNPILFTSSTSTTTASLNGTQYFAAGKDNAFLPSPAYAYFRSKTSGNWSATSSWESSDDGSTWINATVTPSELASTIEIINGHTITLSSDITVDQLIIKNGGKLIVDTNAGILNINNGLGIDVDIQSGAVLQVINSGLSFSYSDRIKFLGSASLNVLGKIIIGDGSATIGSGYGAFGYANSAQIIWNDKAVFEWNTTGPIPEGDGKTYFPGVSASVIPVFKITKIGSGNFGGSNPTVINGKLELNGTTVNWGGVSKKTFRNGIVAIGNGSMIRQTADVGLWQIGNGTFAGLAELGGSTGILTLTNPSGTIISTLCTATLTSNITLNGGTFENIGTLELSTFSISGTALFATRTGSNLITANTGGLVSAITVTGTKTYESGVNYTFNASTMTPFPMSTFGSPAGLTFNNSVIVSNRQESMTVSGNININGNSRYALNPTSNNLSLGGIMTIDDAATFDNNGENSITGGGSIIINGNFITQDAEGFTGGNTAIPNILPTLGNNSTVVFGRNGNQVVTNFDYKNITFSGGGIKNTGTVNVDTYGLVQIIENTTVDAGGNLASTTGNSTGFLMDSGRLILRTTGTQPNMRGIYTLNGSGIVEYSNSSITKQTIRSKVYQNIEVTGSNIANSGGNITLNNNGSFVIKNNGIFTINDDSIIGPLGTQMIRVENGGTFRTSDTDGFSGASNTSVRDNIETIILENNSTVEYSRLGNQTITPLTSTNEYGNLKISGTGTKLLGADVIKVANNLEVISSLLEIGSNKTLRVANKVSTVDTDALNGIYIKDCGSLIQIMDVDNKTGNLNVGKVKMERLAKPMLRYDFSYWSSPVFEDGDGVAQPGEFTLNNLSPLTLADKYYRWNEDLQQWQINHQGTAAMIPGRGYIVRAPQNYDITGTEGIYAANFLGKNNNGIVRMKLKGSSSLTEAHYKWNLIGNPYPSAISAHKFLDENMNTNPGGNNVVAGTLYFWTHNTAVGGSTLSYTPNDYASWNSSGGVATATSNPATSVPELGNNYVQPSGYIAAGQAFFVRGTNDDDTKTVLFNNAMRVDALTGSTNNNNQFFRPVATQPVDNWEMIGKHRIWLNLKGQEKGFNQILVGYIENATNDFDIRYDGETFGGNFVTFYSILDNKNLVIQGRSLPFVNTDTVPLGYSTSLTGNLIISIDQVDGLLNGQDIYLQDNVLNVIHDLKASDYTFATIPGTFNTRFVLRYMPQETLDNPTFNEQIKGVVIRKNQVVLHVNSPFEIINTVSVYDITGRLVFEKTNCNTNTFDASHLVYADQTLIVKVKLNNGGVVTQKVY
ncbi:T9SS sorting signal type C domain-containing protein [Flavobacterium antarcticum]|uniref:T9SS sorting signal type C domain-containing protein n=1 Tax=Flavobacterium antarcticum TaxID=271155 RepID=UPI000417E817|nr:T9SS sorting signal type C domain-containing protein [Flavobacterium antarcticum]